jgi:hypothetical protein
MKKTIFLCLIALLAMFAQSCKDDNVKIDPDDNPKDSVSTTLSIQFANKTVKLPSANFPAIDLTDTVFSLQEGGFKAKLNGVEFNADSLSTGITLPAGKEITIEQNGKVLASFSPKTGGAGTKIKITGIGSTSALANPEGIGKGIYTMNIAEGAATAFGYLIGFNVYTGGDVLNLVKKIELEGGVAYKLRRDHLPSSGNVKDIEGWSTAPTDLGNGYEVTSTQAISIYRASDTNLPVALQIPIVSATALPGSGNAPFVLQRFVKAAGSSAIYYVQGNGDMSCMFKIGNAVRPGDFTTITQGIPTDHSNQDPYARCFSPQIKFQLYLGSSINDTLPANLAHPDSCAYFVSNRGINSGSQYVILKVVNKERVNTMEPLIYIYKRKNTPENANSMIRFEGLAYDAQQKMFVLTAGMAVRSSPY